MIGQYCNLFLEKGGWGLALIDMKNISRVFKIGQVQVNALKNITLTINDKEFVSIM